MLPNFCANESIWETDPIWNSEKPRFSDCFLKTLPVWIPSAFLLIFSLLHVYLIARKSSHNLHNQKYIPLNLYNISRFILVLIVVLSNIAQFAYDLHHYINPSNFVYKSIIWADLSYSIINICTFISFGVFLNFHRLNGIHTSGIVWWFLFSSGILCLPQLYTYAMFYQDDQELEVIHQYSPMSVVTFSIHFSGIVILLFLSSLSDKAPILKQTDDSIGLNEKSAQLAKPKVVPSNVCPDQRASFLSLMTFWWFNSITWIGFKKSLEIEDLWALSPDNTTNELAPRFDQNWNRHQIAESLNSFEYLNSLENKNNKFHLSHNNNVEINPKKKNTKTPGVFGTIVRTFYWQLWAGAFFKLGNDLIKFASPQLLKVFLEYIKKPVSEEPMWHGFLIAVMFFVVSSIQSFFGNHYFATMWKVGMNIRTSLISSIYRKSLKLSNTSRRETTTGEIVNLMSVDAQRLSMMMPYINSIWADPLLIVICMYFLWQELGPSVLAGVAVLLLMIPLNGVVSRFQGKFQESQMKHKDERIKTINELLNGIRVIKLYGWEIPFIGKVDSIRGKEVVQLRKMSYLNAISYVVWTGAPFLVSLLTFGVYVLSSENNILDAQKAFVSLSLFEMLRLPLNMLPEMITQVVMAVVSFRRLNRFLNATELEKYVSHEESNEAITIENGTFSWDQTESQSTLNSINLNIKKGALVAIVGQVGSGKSSLLASILGDIDRVSGRVNVNASSTIAYVPQQAWIRNATLKDNILFGNSFVDSRYKQIIEMCALKPDLEILPGGDQTEIGEKGINLSGGQKQRVAIARACYANADIVLFDDPLSAVDSHVAKHIFTHVLSNKTGFLRNRTRVLATNNISILPDVDQVIVLTGSTISEIGSYQQLMNNSGKFAEFVREHTEDLKDDSKLPKSPTEELSRKELFSRSNSQVSNQSSIRKRKATIQSIDEFDHSSMSPVEGEEEDGRQKLIKIEQAETGKVKMSNYFGYFRSYSYLWLSTMVIGYILKQFAGVGTNIWLAAWSNDVLTGVNGTVSEADIALRNQRLGVYAALGFTQTIFIMIGSFSLAKGAIRCATLFHSRLFDRIMRSPMNFFDTTPLGRIVNRFSKDIDAIDTQIPMSLEGLVFCLLEVISTLIYVAVQIPIFLAAVFPALFLYYFIQKFYLATSRQLKRLDSITRSPIYSHFGETLLGVTTIRAYSLTNSFVKESNQRVDINQQCYYPSYIANRWLAIRLEFCGNLIVLAAAIFAALSKEAFMDNPGFVGLIMTYSLNVTMYLNWVVRMTSEMETNAVSIERINEYCAITTEREWSRPENKDPTIPQVWPNEGKIKFNDYSVRYREGLDLVLSGVSLDIQSGEKVGIVGRTGSGKSTLTLALFRILEASLGKICIDGVEIGKIGLHELRSILSIIPQDPVLFSGTIRTNLDPFSAYSDEQLWEALKHCHLFEYINSLEAGLEYQVAENGENLSIGQRQLICLGRALLRRTKILVLDEATAAIDLETDSLIQETIRSEFAQCTILTIAHRLNTIMDSTRVLVMDQGKVAEFDSPAVLLADKQSRFYSLAKDAKLV